MATLRLDKSVDEKRYFGTFGVEKEEGSELKEYPIMCSPSEQVSAISLYHAQVRLFKVKNIPDEDLLSEAFRIEKEVPRMCKVLLGESAVNEMLSEWGADNSNLKYQAILATCIESMTEHISKESKKLA